MTTASMKAAAADLGHNVEVLYAERDRYRMQELAEQVAARPAAPDYLVLVNEEQFASRALQIAERAGLKTILLLNDIVGESRAKIGEPGERLKHWLGSVIPNNYDAGRRMAERGLSEAQRLGLSNSDGQLVVLGIGGDKTTPAAIERQLGMIEHIAGREDARLDRLFFGRWNEQKSYELTKRYLTAFGAPGLLWAANDAMAEGAVRALKEEGLTPGRDVVVVGLNWSPEGVEMVESGEMLLTDGGHFLGGAWVILALHDHQSNPHQGVVKFNMAALDAAGVQSLNGLHPFDAMEQVDFRAFSRAERGEEALPLSLASYLDVVLALAGRRANANVDQLATGDAPK